MDLSQAILLRNSLRHNNVIMAYNGTGCLTTSWSPWPIC
jgi:hypothetical protein